MKFMRVDEVCETLTPQIKIQKNDYLNAGAYPVIDQSQDFIGGYTNEAGGFEEDEYIIFGDHTCAVKFIDFAFVQGADGIKILRADRKAVMPKYLYYCMSNVKIPASYARHWAKMRAELIPVPPLEVQREIVSTLDRYTSLNTELISSLERERELRMKQYDYYHDKLLASEGAAVMLADIAQYSAERIDASEVNEDNYIGVDNLLQDKRGKTKSVHVPETGKLTAYRTGDILIGNIRPYLRKIWFADTSGGTNGDVLAIHVTDTERVYPKYLYYVLSSEDFFAYDVKNSRGAKMPRGNKQAVMQYRFNLPSMEEQHRIASILDKFNTLCTSHTEGLLVGRQSITAEIEARRKQYEYYRDKLLTFRPA